MAVSSVITPIDLAERGTYTVGSVARTVKYVNSTLDNSEQLVLQIETRGKSRLVVEVDNASGGAALLLFKVYGMVANGSFLQLLGNAATDYTTPIGPLKYCFGANNAATSPITLAANASVIMVLDCQGFDAFKCTAQCATSTTLTLLGQAM